MPEPLTPERLAKLRRRHDDCGCSPVARADFLALLDTIDARDAVIAIYADALTLIAAGLPCRNYTSQFTCRSNSGRRREAIYGAERWCDTCIARDAMERAVVAESADRLVSGQEKDTSEVVRPGTDNEAPDG